MCIKIYRPINKNPRKREGGLTKTFIFVDIFCKLTYADLNKC